MTLPTVGSDAWKTTRIVLKWSCRTSHDRWKKVGLAILARGFETADSVSAGEELISTAPNRDHRAALERCLQEDPGRFWDEVYKYWRARGPHDGLSRETIDLSEFKSDLE